MPYCEGRIVHDADAHLMETPTWLRDHAEPRFRDRLPVLRYHGGNELRQTGNPEEQQRDLATSFDRLRDRAMKCGRRLCAPLLAREEGDRHLIRHRGE